MALSFRVSPHVPRQCIADADALRVRMVRRVTAARLRYCGLPGLVDDAKLIASELVTNAIVHSGGTKITFTMTVGDGFLHIYVRDEMPGVPMAHGSDGESERGRALIRDPGGRTRPIMLTSPGLPLGMGLGTYEPTVLHVPDPVLLLLYSDGMVESRHTDIDQGIARLAALLDTDGVDPERTTGPDTLQSLCRRLLHGTSATNDGGDDRTLLLTELVPANHETRQVRSRRVTWRLSPERPS
ncbi:MULTISPECIES: SpoIIE family protein phosphatase [unclassified Streptomyces]|nr:MULTISPECIES: SpoIIE family protein phosphatase [unclassified Streptomyces]